MRVLPEVLLDWLTLPQQLGCRNDVLSDGNESLREMKYLEGKGHSPASRHGLYADHFGKCQPSTVLRWAREASIPAGTIHLFSPAALPIPAITANWSEEWIEIDGQRILLHSHPA